MTTELCNRRGDILSAAVRIRALSVRSADGQVKKPGRTADGQCGRAANGCARTADGCARTAHGQRTDNTHGQRTDGARTSRSVRRPSANRATLLFYCCFDTFVTKIQCPCAVRAHPSAVRPPSVRIRPLSVRCPSALRPHCPSAVRPQGARIYPETWTESGRNAHGLRTDADG